MVTKIEQVESIRFGDSYLVRIHTESGLTGLGQTACWGYPEAVQQIVERFASYLVGQDPFRIEHHWRKLRCRGFRDRGAIGLDQPACGRCAGTLLGAGARQISD